MADVREASLLNEETAHGRVAGRLDVAEESTVNKLLVTIEHPQHCNETVARKPTGDVTPAIVVLVQVAVVVLVRVRIATQQE